MPQKRFVDSFRVSNVLPQTEQGRSSFLSRLLCFAEHVCVQNFCRAAVGELFLGRKGVWQNAQVMMGIKILGADIAILGSPDLMIRSADQGAARVRNADEFFAQCLLDQPSGRPHDDATRLVTAVDRCSGQHLFDRHLTPRCGDESALRKAFVADNQLRTGPR